MRAFVSYRHSGADARETKELLEKVRAVLSGQSVEAANILFDVRKGDFHTRIMPQAKFMQLAFDMIEGSDFVLALQSSEQRSEGMLIEVGYALAKRVPVVVARKVEVKDTYLPTLAQMQISWQDAADLSARLAAVDFKELMREQATAG